MDLDIKAETAKVEQELQELDTELAGLDKRRQEVVNEMVRKEGILHFLESLDQHKTEEVKRR